MANILVVDEDRGFRERIAAAVERGGHRGLTAGTLAGARRLLERYAVDILCLAAELPDGSGVEKLALLRTGKAPPEVIIMGCGDPDCAEAALRSGAWDCIDRAAHPDRLLLLLRRALICREGKLRTEVPALPIDCGLVGESPRLAASLRQAALAAACGADVLITGETGTGKELLARAIHTAGSRSKGPFAIVDCANLPGGLAESILFGHERGSFTGAEKRQAGLVEQADGGTLFLDEIGELPPAIQSKFLRLLQERSYRPVGGAALRRSDFRLIAATNRDLGAMTGRGEFRTDLLYRLGGFCIDLPPLRKRDGDVRRLLHWRLARAAERTGGKVPAASADYLELLETYDWPGNVREFLQVVDVSLIAARGARELLPQHLPVDLRVRLLRRRRPVGAAGTAPPPAVWHEHRAHVLARAEKEYFSALMGRTHGDIAQAARLAGLKMTRLYELLGKHGILPGCRALRRFPALPK